MIELGFFKLIDHNLDPSLKQKFEEISKSFFDLPFEAKNMVRRELSKNVFRGYYGKCFQLFSKLSEEPFWPGSLTQSETAKSPGVESTNGNPDIKETFAWGQGLLRGSISTWYHGPNLVPHEVDHIQEVFDSYC